MINLTKLALESEEFSFLEKISYLIGPELYHSENIEDFKDNRGKIKVPLSRGFLEKKANIIIFNISIEKIRDTEFYEIRDDSGKLPLIWHNGKGGFSYCSAYTFEMAQEE